MWLILFLVGFCLSCSSTHPEPCCSWARSSDPQPCTGYSLLDHFWWGAESKVWWRGSSTKMVLGTDTGCQSSLLLPLSSPDSPLLQWVWEEENIFVKIVSLPAFLLLHNHLPCHCHCSPHYFLQRVCSHPCGHHHPLQYCLLQAPWSWPAP